MAIRNDGLVRGKHIGNGLAVDENRKKIDVAVDGTTVTFTPDGKLHARAGSSGLDCAAISALPVRAWKKGTTILAKQDAECVQLSALDTLFQDVGVGISANKYTGLVGDNYNVKYTVTNSGEGKNELTTLIITKPLLGAYTISNQTHTSSGVDAVTKVSDTEYRIQGLAKGGTVTVTFDVTATAHGTLQFGGTVTPNSALDTNAVNNKASITLSVNSATDPNIAFSENCPLISAAMGDTPIWTAGDIPVGQLVNNNGQRSNIFWDLDSLAGKSFTLTGAKTVIVTKGISTTAEMIFVSEDSSRMVRSGAVFTRIDDRSPDPVENKTSIVSDYTFNANTGVLTFGPTCTAPSYMVLFSGGVGCRWQIMKLVTTTATPAAACTVSVSGIAARLVTKSSTFSVSGTTPAKMLAALNQIGSKRAGLMYTEPRATRLEFATIRLNKNTAYNFTITSSCAGTFTGFVTKGAVTTTPSSDGRSLTVAVSTQATAQDNLGLSSAFNIIIS